MTDKISNSEIKTFRACRAKHHYAYDRRARPIRADDNLIIGRIWHSWLEADLLGRPRPELPRDANMHHVARLVAMDRAYQDRWRDDRWNALAVEVEFSTEIVNPDTGRKSQTYSLAGKIDAIVETQSGVWIVEHKTSGSDVSAGSKYWQRLRMDTQCSAYILGARSLGFDPRGIIYDVAVKPALRPLAATPEAERKYKKDGTLYASQRIVDETPEEYGARCLELISGDPDRFLARREIARGDDEIRSYQWDLWQDVRTMHESRSAGRHSRNPDSCWQYERECEYFPVCTGGASIDDPHLYEIRTRKHEELSAPVGA